MEWTKDDERRWVRRVLAEIRDLPGTPLVDHEEPDFLLRTSGLVIGIEVTRLFQPHAETGEPLQRRESERDKIVKLAQQIAEQRGLRPLVVDVHFDSRHQINRRDRNRLAEQLVLAVEGDLSEWATDAFTSGKRSASIQGMSNEVDGISVYGFDSLTQHLWQTGEGSIVDQNFAPLLQDEIDKKHKKLPAYLKACDSCWLVVVAPWTGPSSSFELSPTMAEFPFTTAFERIYFTTPLPDGVARLRTEPKVKTQT